MALELSLKEGLQPEMSLSRGDSWQFLSASWKVCVLKEAPTLVVSLSIARMGLAHICIFGQLRLASAGASYPE